MKLTALTLLLWSLAIAAFSQNNPKNLDSLVGSLKVMTMNESDFKAAVNSIIKDPDLYNSLWKNFIDHSKFDKDAKWKLLRDLNIKFKTFQTADNPVTSLGLSYDFGFDYAKYKEVNQNRIAYSFGFSAKGNVAFKKQFNPTDFLETKLDFNYSHFAGGVTTKNNTEVAGELQNVIFKLAQLKDPQGQGAKALWDQFNTDLKLSNQYYYAISPKFSLESNQDFSKKQFVPGLALDLGAKAWNDQATLAKLNIFDYPFALLRLIMGTDKKWTVYGATLPTAQIMMDYVVPADDLNRKGLTGNSDAYPRLKFETGFRTFVARIEKENIFFNSNFRYYRELGAAQVIRNAGLDKQSYFVAALQATSGLFVSYAKGKLPFDAKSDEVYSLGFNYNSDSNGKKDKIGRIY